MSEQESNITIGQKLKETRNQKGYTLDDLQKTTKIQKRYLIAIEDNDFDALPGEFYVRAFVKQYADSVGLNGNEVLEEYKNSIPNTNEPEYLDKVNDDNPETRSTQRQTDERNEKIKRYIPIAIISVAVLAVLIAIWVAAARNTKSPSQTSIDTKHVTVTNNKESKNDNIKVNDDSKKPEKKLAKKATTANFKVSSASGSNVTYDVKSIKSKTMLISATGNAWTSVESDGTTVWQGAQSKNGKHTIKLSASSKIVKVNMGNAAATKLSIDGKKVTLPAPKAGGSNQVRLVTLNFK